MDDNDTITGFPAHKGRELWREGLSSKFKEAKMAVDLEELKRLLAKATPPPWSVWDSCSIRRISHDRDGDVISAYNQRSDGQPDLLAKREDLTLTCSLRNAAPALIEELEATRAKLAALTAPGEYEELVKRLHDDRRYPLFDPSRHDRQEAATAIEQLQARVLELEEQVVLRAPAKAWLEVNERADQAEARLAECKEDAERYRKNWLAFQNLTGEGCMELALPIVEGWKDAAARRKEPT